MKDKNIAETTVDNLVLMYMTKMQSGPRKTPEDIVDEFIAVRRRICERLLIKSENE